MTEAPTDTLADKMIVTPGAKQRARPYVRTASMVPFVAALVVAACGTSVENAGCEGRYRVATGDLEFSYQAPSSIEILVPGELEPTGTTSPSANWIEIRDTGSTFVVLTSMSPTAGDGAWVSPEFTEFCADSNPVFVNELSSDDDAALEVHTADGTTHDVTLSRTTQLVRGQTSSMQFPDLETE